MKNIIKKIEKNITLRKTTNTARRFFSACMMFALVTSWAYGILPFISLDTKNAEAAAAWNMRQEINILTSYVAAPSGSYATSSEIININTTEYSGTVSYYVEVVASSSSALSTNFYLKRITGQTVATLTPNLTTSYDVYRSASFTPTAGSNDYVLVVGNESGATKGVEAARVVILQSFAGTANSAATSTETQIEIGNYETYSSAQATSTFSAPKYWYYDSSVWDGTTTFYAEVSYQTLKSFASSTTYSTAGTYTVVTPAFTASSTIELRGAGGAGGAGTVNSNGSGSGGAGGQYARSTIYGTSGNNTLVVGAGATGGAAGGPTGNDSTWANTVVVAKGGIGGAADSGTAGTGSTSGGVGDVVYAGGNGAVGVSAGTAGGGGEGGCSTGTGGSASGGTGGNSCDGGNGATGLSTNGAGATGTAPGGGGAGGRSTGNPNVNGGSGGAGQAVITNYLASTTIVVQESDGTGDNFTGWTDKAYIVVGGAVSTSTRARSSAFTPTTGRNYRIAFRNGDSRTTFAIYNAKIIVDQVSASEFTKLEPQYLLANTSLVSGTGLQTALTKWDSSEWSGVANTYIHQVEAANNSTSVVTVNTAGAGTLVTGSTVTSPDNRGVSSGMTMPANGNLDIKATTNNGDVYASRILVQVAPPVTISGTVYSSEGGSNIGSGKTITAYKNGSTLLGSAVTDSNGAYNMTRQATYFSGDVITVYIDGDTTKGSRVYIVGDSASQSGIDIYGGTLLVQNSGITMMSNSDMSLGYVSGDSADMVYSVSAGNLTVNSNVELHFSSGNSPFSAGGTVTTQGTGNLHIDDSANITLDTNTNSIAGDIVVDTGATLTLDAHTTVGGGDITTSGTGSVTYSSNNPTVTISGSGSIGGGSGTLQFYNLTISSTGTVTSTANITLNGALTVNSSGSLVFSGGTVTANATSWGVVNSGTLTFNNFTVAETPTSQPSASFSVGGTFTVNSSKTFAPTGGTVTMAGGSIVNNNSLSFYNLTIGGSVSTSATFNVINNFTSNNSSSLSTSGGVITVTGDASISGTVSGSGSITINGGDVTGNGTLNFSSGTFTLDGNGLFGGNTNWTFNQLFFGDGSGVATTTSTGTNSITAATTTVRASQILDAGVSKTWNITGAFEPFGLQGTLLASSSTFNFQTPYNATITPATYYNLYIGNDLGTGTYILGTTTSQTINVRNNFWIYNGVVDANTYDPVVDVDGTFELIDTTSTFSASNSSPLYIGQNFTNGSGGGVFTHNNGTVIFDTTSTAIISSLVDISFYNVTSIIPGKTLKFSKHTANVPTFTIAGTMTVTGSESTPVYLESDTQDNDWMINFSGAQSTITYTSIRDAACAVGSASVTSYITNTNRGNNDSCWGFLVYSIFSSGPVSVEQGSGGGALVTGGGSGAGGGSSEQGSGGGTGSSGGGNGGGGGQAAP